MSGEKLHGDVRVSEGLVTSSISAPGGRCGRGWWETLPDTEQHSPLHYTTERRLGGPTSGEDTGLGARRRVRLLLSPQALRDLRKHNSPQDPISSLWTVGRGT